MLVFHAGPHKTATTYLQENLRAARRDLTSRGWRYPHQGTGGLAGHHEIALAPPDWLDQGGEGRQALARVPRTGNLVFSSEGAARWSPERYHALADALGRDRIDVVHALRDPVDLFQSHWAEQVKQGHVLGLADRMAEHFADPSASNILNPLPVLEPLLADPRIRLHAIPFEVLRRDGIDIYSHFCAAVLGLDGMTPRRRNPRNTAMPIHETEFLRLMTLVAAEGERHIGSDLRKRFLAEIPATRRREMGALVRNHGQNARRQVDFPERQPFKQDLETRLRAALAGHWTHDPGDAPLYRTEPQSYAYYDAFVLLQVPQVVEAAERCLASLGYGGPAMRGLRTILVKLDARWRRLK